jgi:hypothetical protein
VITRTSFLGKTFVIDVVSVGVLMKPSSYRFPLSSMAHIKYTVVVDDQD